MKALKLDHKQAELILSGKRVTWRLYDDKDLSVNDFVRLIDKKGSRDGSDWAVIGTAQIDKVTEKPIGAITPAEYDQEGSYRNQQEMLDSYRHYHQQDVTADTPLKIVHFKFTGANEEYYKNDNTSNTTFATREVKIFADGGSRGNPGPSASGFVILDMNDGIVVKKGMYLGVTTNNQAEYQAVRSALEEARKLQAQIVHVYLDSLLVVNQMTGSFKVKNRDLWPIHAAIKELTKSFKRVSFTHVPRELNKIADSAVNQALDEALKNR